MSYTKTLKGKIIIGAVTVSIIMASLVGILYNKIEDAKSENDIIILKADSLMAVKNELQNELATLTRRLTNKKVVVANLDSKNAVIESREVALKQVRDELVLLEESENSEINALKTKISELEILKTTLEKSMVALKESDLVLINKNKDLQVKMLLLESQLRDAKSEIKAIKYLASADNFRVEVLKPNTQLTVKAKKARTLRVSMIIPSFLKAQIIDSKPIYLSILDEKNKPISGWNELVIVKDEKLKDVKMEVHSSKRIDFNKNPQSIFFDFTIENRLLPGLYSAKLYTTDSYLGTVEFRVRGSFWFF